MSLTQLLVLGVVRMSQPVHGYDVRRALWTWRADEWANVSPGLIWQVSSDAPQRYAGLAYR